VLVAYNCSGILPPSSEFAAYFTRILLPANCKVFYKKTHNIPNLIRGRNNF